MPDITIEQLIAIIAAATPITIAIFSGFINALTKAKDAQSHSWVRHGELCAILYNKNVEDGLWQQLSAIHELGYSTAPQKKVAETVLRSARISFTKNGQLVDAIDIAIVNIQRSRGRKLVEWITAQ